MAARRKKAKPSWMTWLEESKAEQAATRKVLDTDPSARAFVDAAVRQVRQNALNRKLRAEKQQARTQRKLEARQQRNRRRRDLDLIHVPIAVASSPIDYTARANGSVPNECRGTIGTVTIDALALANALGITDQLKGRFAPPGLRPWQSIKRSWKHHATALPLARYIAGHLTSHIERWLHNVVIEQWTQEQVLTLLETLPRNQALGALALPMVQAHIGQIQTGRSEAYTRVRARLERVLVKLTTVPKNRGRHRPSTPHLNPDTVGLLYYGQLLPEVKRLKGLYSHGDEESITQVYQEIESLAAQYSSKRRDWAKLLRAMAPYYVTQRILADHFGASMPDVSEALRANRNKHRV